MLTIYLEGLVKTDAEIVKDIEKEFESIKLPATDLNKFLIEKTEQGKYNDEQSFINKHGQKLPINCLRKSSKAALCVVNIPNKVIDITDCNNRVRDIIVRYCNVGNIIIEDNGLTISTIINGNQTDVLFYGTHITDIDKLNNYIDNWILYV